MVVPVGDNNMDNPESSLEIAINASSPFLRRLSAFAEGVAQVAAVGIAAAALGTGYLAGNFAWDSQPREDQISYGASPNPAYRKPAVLVTRPQGPLSRTQSIHTLSERCQEMGGISRPTEVIISEFGSAPDRLVDGNCDGLVDNVFLPSAETGFYPQRLHRNRMTDAQKELYDGILADNRVDRYTTLAQYTP